MSEELKRTIEDDDIEWLMPWSNYGEKDKPDEMMFEKEDALAIMLINEVIFLNNHWWEKEWPKEAQETVALCVNCNDIFAWGCADAEDLPYSEIEHLYRAWKKDPVWGSAIWCIQRRNQMPQKPVEDRIRKAGIWDLDAMGVGKNTQDAEVQALFRAYAANINAEAKVAP